MKSRTDNVITNTKVVIICQITSIVLGFVCRTVFSYLLGTEYLGINGLFSNILSILSFTELGIGSAMEFRLYKPLIQKNHDIVSKYISVYRQMYQWIIIVFFFCGALAAGFLPILVTAPNVDENIIILYFVFLLNTGLSYFYAYKKSLLIADQKSYIVNIISQIILIIKNVAQIIILFISKDFILYCLTGCFFTLADNYICSLYVDKKYKFIQIQKGAKLEKEERKGFLKDIRGLAIQRIFGAAIESTDNLFISAFIGLNIIGIISNYKLIFGTFSNLLDALFRSVKASFGNLYIADNASNTEKNFKRSFFFSSTIYGYLAIVMFLLLREFITEIWLTHEYYLTDVILISMLIEWLMRGIHTPIYTLGNAMGLFSQYRIVIIVSAICNIFLDFILVKPLGVSGLYLATIICNGVNFMRDDYVVYHYGFKKNLFHYYLMLGKWCLCVMSTGMISFVMVNIVSISGVIGFCIKGVLITAIYFVSILVFSIKSEEFIFFIKLAKKQIEGIKVDKV